MLPSLKFVPYKTLLQTDERPDMAKVDNLLERKIAHINSSVLATIEDEVGHCTAVVEGGVLHSFLTDTPTLVGLQMLVGP